MKKVLLVFLAILVVYVLSHIGFVPMNGNYHSVLGAVASWLVPDNAVLYKLVKEVLTSALIALVIVSIAGWRNLFGAWGVNHGFLLGWGVGLLFCLPMIIVHLIFGKVEYSTDTMFRYAIFPGLFEELMFRGFFFGMLFRYCKWGFVWAALPTALLFTLGHLAQSHDLTSMLLVFAVTAFGSLLFSWLYVEWNFNLWVPIALHVGMDAVWSLIPIEGIDHSMGNLPSNIGRVLTLVLVVVITVLYKKRQGKKLFDYKVW